jgi:CRP-like cAMP-binding protein
VQHTQGDVLFEAGSEVDQVYFPLSGMVSIVVLMRDGKAVETATVGRAGVIGAMSGLGLYTTGVRIIVQIPMFASRISSTALSTIVASNKPIAELCIRYNEALLVQTRLTAACNTLHHV